MLDVALASRLSLHQHDVEPTSPIRPVPLGKILRGHPDELFLFASINGQHRTTEGVSCPSLHLDKYQYTLILGNQIKLAERSPKIPIKDPISFCTLEPFRQLLTLTTELMARIQSGLRAGPVRASEHLSSILLVT